MYVPMKFENLFDFSGTYSFIEKLDYNNYKLIL